MPAQPTSPAREAIRGTVPKLAEISDTLIYGEVWERPGLSRRDRSLITVAALLAMGRDKHLRRLARRNDRRARREGGVREGVIARSPRSLSTKSLSSRRRPGPTLHHLET